MTDDGPSQRNRLPMVSIVLPAYNEERILGKTVHRTVQAADRLHGIRDYEVIVTDNGSTDGTESVARAVADEIPDVQVLSVPDAGRGRALDEAFEAARGDVLIYYDVDLATDLDHLQELVDAVAHEGADVATGSRWVPGHEADRPLKRSIPSRGFNWLCRALLGSDLRDHQCGFKAVDARTFEELKPHVADEHWFWDTELLVLAQDRGYEVHEFPVDWTPRGDSKFALGRDIASMGAKATSLAWTLHAPEALNSRRTLLSMLVLACAAVALAYVVDPGRILAAAANVDPLLLVAAGFVYATTFLVRGFRYKELLGKIGWPTKLLPDAAAVAVSQTVNLVAPARTGDLSRAEVMRDRYDIPYEDGVASLTLERATDLLAISGLAVASLALGAATGLVEPSKLLATGGDVRPRTVTALYTALLAVGGISLGGILWMTFPPLQRAPAWFRDAGERHARRVPLGDRLLSFLAALDRGTRGGGVPVSVLAASVAIWLLDSTVAALVLWAVGVPVAPGLAGVVVLGVSLGNLAKVLPLTPGGIGLYEAAFTLAVTSLTPLAWPLVLTAAIVDHALKNSLTVVAGLVGGGALNLDLGAVLDADPETVEGALARNP